MASDKEIKKQQKKAQDLFNRCMKCDNIDSALALIKKEPFMTFDMKMTVAYHIGRSVEHQLILRQNEEQKKDKQD